MAKRFISAVYVDRRNDETKVILDNGDELHGVSSIQVHVAVDEVPQALMKVGILENPETTKES